MITIEITKQRISIIYPFFIQRVGFFYYALQTIKKTINDQDKDYLCCISFQWHLLILLSTFVILIASFNKPS